jgi:hypothetical protein
MGDNSWRWTRGKTGEVADDGFEAGIGVPHAKAIPGWRVFGWLRDGQENDATFCPISQIQSDAPVHPGWFALSATLFQGETTYPKRWAKTGCDWV